MVHINKSKVWSCSKYIQLILVFMKDSVNRNLKLPPNVWPISALLPNFWSWPLPVVSQAWWECLWKSASKGNSQTAGGWPHLIGRLCSFKSRCLQTPGGVGSTSYCNTGLLHGFSNCWDNGVIIWGKMACQRHDKPSRLREELSCMLVGDGAVGKTSMIISYIFNGYNSEYRQTAFDVFTGE